MKSKRQPVQVVGPRPVTVTATYVDDPSSAVNRTVSGSGTSRVSVSLHVTAGTSVDAFTVQETLPNGLIPSTISSGGTWEPIGRTLTWALLVDTASQILTYKLTGTAGDYTLTGTGDFTGSDINTAGDCAIQIGLPEIVIVGGADVEGNIGYSFLSFSVVLPRADTQTVDVTYATTDGTAVAGSDYVPINGTLTFDPGQTEIPLVVSVIGDMDVEPDETFHVVLSAPNIGTIPQGEASGTILDDDDMRPVLDLDGGLPGVDMGVSFARVGLPVGIVNADTLTITDPGLLKEACKFFIDVETQFGVAQIEAGADALWFGGCNESTHLMSVDTYMEELYEKERRRLH